MRLIDADKLIEEIKKQAGCESCDNYHGIRCKACQWDDAMDTVDDFADNHEAVLIDKWTELREEIQELHENNADKPNVENVTKYLLNFISVLDEGDDTHD